MAIEGSVYNKDLRPRNTGGSQLERARRKWDGKVDARIDEAWEKRRLQGAEDAVAAVQEPKKLIFKHVLKPQGPEQPNV